ncbi:hypothetical protein DRM21_21500 [Salmonella enterica subsp. enterica serovar Virchow]|nr:hypothetical protein [Salmonella enterica subsp. enterica serovar Virchow]EBX3020508.1 hypothetical protein [Salmonella enterica subsp. enterica serovar Virchow]EBX3249867.1 hypothetical protein [Salmonella enterica subsp. enterica serovar Java]
MAASVTLTGIPQHGFFLRRTKPAILTGENPMTYPRITLSALAGLVLLSGQVMAAGTTPSADGQTGGVFTPEQEARIGQVAADYLLAHPDIRVLPGKSS